MSYKPNIFLPQELLRWIGSVVGALLWWSMNKFSAHNSGLFFQIQILNFVSISIYKAVSTIFQYGTHSTITMPWTSNKLTSISPGTKPCELFCAMVHRFPFHCIDWRFVDELYLKTHDSSPGMIHPRSVGSASQSFKNVSAMKTLSFFYSGIETFKTSFEYTFFIFKFCRRILCTLVHEISVLSATSLIIFWWSF